MKKLLLAGLLSFAPALLASAADLKIAVIDFQKVIDQYYKTKDMRAKIDTDRKALEKDEKAMQAEFNQILTDFQKFQKQAADMTLTKAARDEATASAQQKQADIENYRLRFHDYDQEHNNEINEKAFRLQKVIVDDITKAVSDFAAPQGYDMVVVNQVNLQVVNYPVVLFHSSKLTDITADVVSKLNAGAPPAGAPAPSGTTPPP